MCPGFKKTIFIISSIAGFIFIINRQKKYKSEINLSLKKISDLSSKIISFNQTQGLSSESHIKGLVTESPLKESSSKTLEGGPSKPMTVKKENELIRTVSEEALETIDFVMTTSIVESRIAKGLKSWPMAPFVLDLGRIPPTHIHFVAFLRTPTPYKDDFCQQQNKEILKDMGAILQKLEVVKKELESLNGRWFL